MIFREADEACRRDISFGKPLAQGDDAVAAHEDRTLRQRMDAVMLAREAMATRFEVVLHGENATALRAAAEEALDEIERVEAQLSLYGETSEISFINAHAAATPVRVEPGLFRLLQRAQRLQCETEGAFDITVAPLMRCWGFMRGPGKVPNASDLAAAREKVGMRLVTLNEEDFTVRFAQEGVMLDLGALGKGYAIERAVELLTEAGVASGLIHGGTSTVHALGAPPDASHWTVALPHVEAGVRRVKVEALAQGKGSESILATVLLRNESLSVSAVWGKCFEADGQVYGHVMDPRQGRPAVGAVMSAVVARSATESDALSTALLVAGAAGQERIAALRPGLRSLVVSRSGQDGPFHIATRGIELSFRACQPTVFRV